MQVSDGPNESVCDTTIQQEFTASLLILGPGIQLCLSINLRENSRNKFPLYSTQEEVAKAQGTIPKLNIHRYNKVDHSILY